MDIGRPLEDPWTIQSSHQHHNGIRGEKQNVTQEVFTRAFCVIHNRIPHIVQCEDQRMKGILTLHVIYVGAFM